MGGGADEYWGPGALAGAEAGTGICMACEGACACAGAGTGICAAGADAGAGICMACVGARAMAGWTGAAAVWYAAIGTYVWGMARTGC